MSCHAELHHDAPICKHGHIKMIFHCSVLFTVTNIDAHHACKQIHPWKMITMHLTCTGVSDHKRYRAVKSQKWKVLPTRHLHYACAYVFQGWDTSSNVVIRNWFLYTCKMPVTFENPWFWSFCAGLNNSCLKLGVCMLQYFGRHFEGVLGKWSDFVGKRYNFNFFLVKLEPC